MGPKTPSLSRNTGADFQQQINRLFEINIDGDNDADADDAEIEETGDKTDE